MNSIRYRQGESNSAQPRTGETPQLPGLFQGGCLSVFGIPFLLFGSFFIIQAVRDHLHGKTGVSSLFFAVPFGIVFAGIGASMSYYGLVRVLGIHKISGATMKLIPETVDFQNHPYFPKHKSKRKGPRGGVLLDFTAEKAGCLFGLIMMTFIWNALSWGGLYAILREHKGGSETVGLIIVSIFAAVGVLIFCSLVYTIIKRIVTGRSLVEVFNEPVFSGQNLKLLVYTTRELQVERAEVIVRCLEKTVSGSGEDSTSKTEVVYTENLRLASNLSTRPTVPAMEIPFTIPADAMHSFRAPNNIVEWEVLVKMKVSGKPDIDDAFQLRVAPGAPK